MGHLKEWFLSHDKCPTGCGCLCTLGGSGSQTIDLTTNQRDGKAGPLISASQNSVAVLVDKSARLSTVF